MRLRDPCPGADRGFVQGHALIAGKHGTESLRRPGQRLEGHDARIRKNVANRQRKLTSVAKSLPLRDELERS